MRRRLVAIAVGVAAVVAAVWAWRGDSSKPPPLKLMTAPVQKGKLIARVTATGTLSALVTVQVGSQVSGRIQEIRVDFNTPVKKGQLIAKIDPQLFMAAVEQAKANDVAARGNLARVQAQAVEAQRQYERLKQLRAENLVAQADYDTAESSLAAAKAQVAASEGAVAQARASLNQAQINLNYTTIASPISGVVISRSVDVGQTVAASLQAPTLFTIAEDLKKMQVDTNVAEADVGKLTPGMKATFTVDAFPSEKWTGTVRQIRNAPQTVQNVVTYDAVIDVDNPELKLKPGMTANVTFVYAERDDVIKVPNAALRFKPPPEMLPDGGARPERTAPDRRTVWVQKTGQKPAPQVVRVGVTDGTVSEIVDGALKEGDLVVTDAIGEPKVPPAFRRGL